MTLHRVVLALACVLCPALAAADGAVPLAGVGTLKSRPEGGCSAALIAPDVVLTAAHCVHGNRQGGRNLVFRTGAYPGQPAIEVPVAAFAVHPLYELNLRPETARIRFDLALVRLARPVDEPGIVPLGLGEAPAPGDRLLLASFRGGQGDRARERRCEIFPGPTEVVALGCEVAGGESGSPLMRVGPEGPEIVAVLSSRTKFDQQPIGLASPVLARIGPIFDILPEAEVAAEAIEAAPEVEGAAVLADP
jgi:hypothetical protein